MFLRNKDCDAFGLTHKAEKALHQMSFAPYHCDIAEFMVKIENLNTHAHVTAVVMREMIEDQLHMEAEQRLSIGQ